MYHCPILFHSFFAMGNYPFMGLQDTRKRERRGDRYFVSGGKYGKAPENAMAGFY